MQKYLFIPLDIFRENKHNRDIKVKRDAWLTLFSSDDPDRIIELIEEYPEFRQIYEEAYEICLNVERVMDMFSKELYELDKNTAQYMIDEMQETIDKMQEAHVKEIDEIQKRGIRNTVKILQDLDVPGQEIRTRICEQYQISEEQIQEFFDQNENKQQMMQL